MAPNRVRGPETQTLCCLGDGVSSLVSQCRREKELSVQASGALPPLRQPALAYLTPASVPASQMRIRILVRGKIIPRPTLILTLEPNRHGRAAMPSWRRPVGEKEREGLLQHPGEAGGRQGRGRRGELPCSRGRCVGEGPMHGRRCGDQQGQRALGIRSTQPSPWVPSPGRGSVLG